MSEGLPPEALQLGLIVLLDLPPLIIKISLQPLQVIDTRRAGQQLLPELCGTREAGGN